MTEAKILASDSDLLRVVKQIVDKFHPWKIILFGSRAYGEPTKDSDVDLLVVMETDRNPLHMAACIAAAVDHPFPIDILVVRPADWEEAQREGNIFETEVMNKGIVLYEATSTRMD
jgi:predicted nucleotidyltransferase